MTARIPDTALGLAALLLATWLLPASAQTSGAAPPPPPVSDGTVELSTWPSDAPQYRVGQICSVEGTSISCHGQHEDSGQVWSTRLSGTISGSTIVGRSRSTTTAKSQICAVTIEDTSAITLVLGSGGSVTGHTSNRTLSTKRLSGPCESWSKAESDLTLAGRWRQATIAEPNLAAVPQPPGVAGREPSVRVEGNTIYVAVGEGRRVNIALVQPTRAPAFTAPTVGAVGKEFERYVMTRLYETSYAHLPPDMRSTFISGLDMPSDVATEAAEKAVQAGESAANWARNNPAEVALVGLTVAVSVAFPFTAFANPALAAGGATLSSEIVGGAVLAATVGGVSRLSKDFLTEKSAGQRAYEASVEAIAAAATSVPGNLAGGTYSRALDAAIRNGVATTAITGGSVVVGLGTDRLMQNLDVSQKTVDLLMGTAPYRRNLVTPPRTGPRELGGITIKFD
jgi:hypothetical protein